MFFGAVVGFAMIMAAHSSLAGMRSSTVSEVQEERERAKVRCVDGPYWDPVAPVRLACSFLVQVKRIETHMIHIIDLHLFLYTMSTIGIIRHVAPRARKMSPETVKAVGTS